MFNYLVNYFKALMPQKSKKGQALVEYALIVGLIAVLLIAALTATQVQLKAAFQSIVTALGGGTIS